MIAAGRPQSAPSASPCLFFTGRGQLTPRRPDAPSGRGRTAVVLSHPLLVEREDVGAARGVQQEVGIFDALGDALVRQQFAES